MGTKNNPGEFDCYSKAAPDEPMFILLGRDPAASAVVDYWVFLRDIHGKTESAVLAEARTTAKRMAEWAISVGKGAQIEEIEMLTPNRVQKILEDNMTLQRENERLSNENATHVAALKRIREVVGEEPIEIEG